MVSKVVVLGMSCICCEFYCNAICQVKDQNLRQQNECDLRFPVVNIQHYSHILDYPIGPRSWISKRVRAWKEENSFWNFVCGEFKSWWTCCISIWPVALWSTFLRSLPIQRNLEKSVLSFKITFSKTAGFQQFLRRLNLFVFLQLSACLLRSDRVFHWYWTHSALICCILRLSCDDKENCYLGKLWRVRRQNSSSVGYGWNERWISEWKCILRMKLFNALDSTRWIRVFLIIWWWAIWFSPEMWHLTTW